MTESIPPADAPPPEAAATARRVSYNWHRIRVYLLGILLMVSMWMGGALVTIRLHPERIIDSLLSQLPYSYSTGKVYWINRRTLKIDDVKIGGFFYAESITAVASPFGLWRHHIAKVQVLGGQLFTKPFYAALDQYPGATGDGIDWVIGRLEIQRGTVLLQNLIASTSIPVRLGVRSPIVLTALRLGKPDASPEMQQERTVEIGAVSVSSPIDPLSPVFYFPLTRVRFTYGEFWHHRIREIDVIRPTMHLGEDLFWLTQQFKDEESSTTATQGPEAPWRISRFKVEYGRLAVNAFGQPVVHLPFFFDTKVDNIRLDQLDQISAKSVIAIRRLDQDYPDYKIRLVNLRGRLFFSWPPTDAKANNVVNTIDIDEVAWNGIAVKNVSTIVTFDPNGVYGKLTNGTCEGGLLNGNFEFYYARNFNWNADFFANRINCEPIAEKLAGKYAKLTGELDGRIDVQGKSTEILHCGGLMALPHPGRLNIKSMDELIKRIPADLAAVKRDVAKLAINAFQDYPYENGQLKLEYKPGGGTSVLQLDGPVGQRKFEVDFHPFTEANGDAQGPHVADESH